MTNKEIEIKNIEIGRIKIYEKNNKKHTSQQVIKLAKQIKANGYDVPIVIDENFVILKGHCRLLALQKLNYTVVPCIIREGLSEKQKKQIRIADNKLAESEWDLDNLLEEVNDLKLDIDFDLELLGFDEDELDKLLKINNDEEDGEDADDILKSEYVLHILCDNENQQKELYAELNNRKIKVKII